MTQSVGTRVAALRKTRGLTQRQLAELAHISHSLLTKVESGHAPATPVAIGALARALRVDIPRLTGQPYEAASATSPAIYEPISQLRRLLLAYDIPMPPDAPPRSLPTIAADVGAMSELRRATNFRKLAGALPALVEELQYLALTTAGHERGRSFTLLAEAYYGVECLASGVGYQDVYLLAIERITWAATHSGDPLLIAAAAWGRAGPLMREGAHAAGLHLLARARDALTATDAATLAVTGSIHLREASLAARAARPAEAWDHIAQARELAARVGETNICELGFGPANTAIYAAEIAVDLGDGARAIHAADACAALAAPAERVGLHHIGLARARLMLGQHRHALDCLLTARHIAPQQTRHHPMVRETLLVIASHTRGSSEDLSRFASWLGLD